MERVLGCGRRPTQPSLPGTLGEHEAAALAFHAEHPELFRFVVKKAFQAKARGLRKYGMGALFELARWHFHVERGEREFKLNNNWRATYSRLVMLREPRLAGFFETRDADVRSVPSG